MTWKSSTIWVIFSLIPRLLLLHWKDIGPTPACQWQRSKRETVWHAPSLLYCRCWRYLHAFSPLLCCRCWRYLHAFPPLLCCRCWRYLSVCPFFLCHCHGSHPEGSSSSVREVGRGCSWEREEKKKINKNKQTQTNKNKQSNKQMKTNRITHWRKHILT